MYINKSLAQQITFRLNRKQWITVKQKKLLINYINICQINLFAVSIKKTHLSKVFYFMEFMLNSLLFQIYVIEMLVENKKNKITGINNKILKDSSQNKLKLLLKLKNFMNKKSFSFKRRYISYNTFKKCSINIINTIDFLVQELFILVLDPFVEANLSYHCYKFCKSHNPIAVCIDNIYKSLKNKTKKSPKNLEQLFIWNVSTLSHFNSINCKQLVKNTPFPSKYKYILRNLLEFDYIKFKSNKTFENVKKIFQKKIFSLLITNLVLNGIEHLIHRIIVKYKINMLRARLKYRFDGQAQLFFNHKRLDGSFKESRIICNFSRYAKNFVILCTSKKLLILIKKKFLHFLQRRGLQIDLNKTKTTLLKVNCSVNFLGYTFIYLIRTKFIYNKLLHRNKREHCKKNCPKLFVCPSRSAIQSFKKCLKNLIKNNQNNSAYQLIAILNPIIKG